MCLCNFSVHAYSPLNIYIFIVYCSAAGARMRRMSDCKNDDNPPPTVWNKFTFNAKLHAAYCWLCVREAGDVIGLLSHIRLLLLWCERVSLCVLCARRHAVYLVLHRRCTLWCFAMEYTYTQPHRVSQYLDSWCSLIYDARVRMPAIVIYIVRAALIFSKKQQPAERKVVQTDNSAAVVINSTRGHFAYYYFDISSEGKTAEFTIHC